MLNKEGNFVDTRTPEQKLRERYQMTDVNMSADVLSVVHTLRSVESSGFNKLKLLPYYFDVYKDSSDEEKKSYLLKNSDPELVKKYNAKVQEFNNNLEHIKSTEDDEMALDIWWDIMNIVYGKKYMERHSRSDYKKRK